MEHIEQAIRDAVEKGWNQNKPPFEHRVVTANQYWIVMLDANGTEYTLAVETAFLDPSFWQALGKARGWGDALHGLEFQKENGDREYLYWKGENGHQYRPHMLMWQIQWHRFIDHLADGKDANSFFETL